MRAIAVIAVIINHFSHSILPGGYLGVDIFFVISGYVITASLEKSAGSSLSEQLLRFYSRRIKRLMPALLCMVLVSSSLIRLFDPDALVSTLTGVCSVFGMSNMFLFSEATNYFGHSAERNVFSHTWSLGVEEQFYLLYPFLIRWRMPISVRSLWDDRFRLGAIITLSAISLLLFIWVYPVNQPAAYFLMPFRFFELGSGCLLALLTRDLRVRDGLVRPFYAGLALILMVPPLALADNYPVASTITIVLATFLLIGSVQRGTPVYQFLSKPLASYLGKISYSLYLWHWPVICISRWTVGIHLWTLPFQLAATLALSAASYHLVEHPLRGATWIGGRRGVLYVGLPTMAMVAALVFFGQRYSLPRFSGNRSAEAALDAPVPGYVAKYSKRKIDDCFASLVFDKANKDSLASLRKCTADNNADVELMFVGDSHAMDLFPMADQIYKDGLASVLNVFQTGCRVPRLQNEGALCEYPLELVRKAVPGNSGNKILVIRNNYAPRFINGELGEFSKRLEELLKVTAAAGVKVIYVAPGPKFYSVGPQSFCTAQWFRPTWAMSEDCRTGFREDREEELARRRDLFDYLVSLSRKRTDFFVFDPFDPLCGGSQGDCTPMRGGRIIYRDDSHITVRGSELLVAPFESFLKKQGLLTATRKVEHTAVETLRVK
jgi:peptidoglycan/LPS O-acetylase OafA/YrhL